MEKLAINVTVDTQFFCITLWEPWATLIARGEKRIETRSWRPPAALLDPQSLLVIHAGKAWGPQQAQIARSEPVHFALGEDWPAVHDEASTWKPPTLGMALCVTRVVGSIEFGLDRDAIEEEAISQGCEPARFELSLGDFRPGRHGWLLAEPQPLAEPVPIVGLQRVWRLRGPREEALRAACATFATTDGVRP